MTDETKKPMSDDEYQFPSEEFITTDHDTAQSQSEAEHDMHYDEAAESSRSGNGIANMLDRIQSLPHKRIIGVAIVAVIALGVFSFLRPSKTVKPVVKKPHTSALQSAFNKQQQAQSQVLSQLSSFKQDQQSNQSSINQLQNQVANLQNALNQAHAQQAQMAQAVQSLVTEVKALNQDIANLSRPKHHRRKKSGPTLTFTLKAVVPDRAWILGSNGESDSVTIGAEVPQYGYVTAINANAGVVKTSSGKVIRYGQNDF